MSISSDFAEKCVEAVKRMTSLELTYDSETLPILDHYINEARAGIKESKGGDAMHELLVPMVGAYFGETLKRQFGAVRWFTDQENFQIWRLEFEELFLFFNPLGMAFEAFEDERISGWGSHLGILPEQSQIIHDCLENVGAVQKRDFHRLSVRFEAIELVVATLSELRLSSGEKPDTSALAYANAANPVEA